MENLRVITADKINPIPIGAGMQVEIYEVGGGQVIRVPMDRAKDTEEHLARLVTDREFEQFTLPFELVCAEIRGQMRRVLATPLVHSPMLDCSPSATEFKAHLGQLKPIEAQIKFLFNMREFIEACKRSYRQDRCIPDLVGTGNLIAVGVDLKLLDTNNVVGNWICVENLEVPLDDREFPVFDLGLRFLHETEWSILTHHNGTFSTEDFNDAFRQERIYRGPEVPRELEGILTSREGVAADPFYAPIHSIERAKRVDNIMARRRGILL